MKVRALLHPFRTSSSMAAKSDYCTLYQEWPDMENFLSWENNQLIFKRKCVILFLPGLLFFSAVLYHIHLTVERHLGLYPGMVNMRFLLCCTNTVLFEQWQPSTNNEDTCWLPKTACNEETKLPAPAHTERKTGLLATQICFKYKWPALNHATT